MAGENADEKPDQTEFASELIWAYCAIGVFVLAILLRFVWQKEGMTSEFEFERWRVVIFAAAFGFGLGWLLYPRRLPSNNSNED